jgi:hypothetical protein
MLALENHIDLLRESEATEESTLPAPITVPTTAPAKFSFSSSFFFPPPVLHDLKLHNSQAPALLKLVKTLLP